MFREMGRQWNQQGIFNKQSVTLGGNVRGNKNVSFDGKLNWNNQDKVSGNVSMRVNF